MNQPSSHPFPDDSRDTEALIPALLAKQPALSLARRVSMRRSRVEVPALPVGRRRTLSPAKPGTAEVEHEVERAVVLVSCRLSSPWEVTEEFLADDGAGEARLERSMIVAIGNDLQDLAFNGDEESADHLLCSTDGWLKQMTLRRRWSLRRRNVKRRELSKALATLDAGYRANRERLRFFVCMDTFLDLIEDGARNLADDYQAGVQATPPMVDGVPVVAVPMLRKGHALLSHPDNLVLGFENQYKVRKTTEGLAAIERDVRMYCAHLRMAVEVQDPLAGFHIEARPWHVIFGRVGAFVAKRYSRTKWRIKRAVQNIRNRHQARREAKAA